MMEKTRHINSKSDFVLRERFRDADGNTVALPDVDFTLRYWVKRVAYTRHRARAAHTPTAWPTAMQCW